MQRRQFIISGIGVAASSSLGAVAALAASGAPVQLSAATFSAVLHQPFNIYDSARGVTVELVKVREVAGSGGLRQFSLSFKGRAEDGLDTGTYEVEHPSTGKMLMYLDADKRGKHGVTYRADFSLM